MKKLAPNSIELWAINAEKEFALSKRPMGGEEMAMLDMVSPIEKSLTKRFLLEDDLENNLVPIPCACVFYNRVKKCHTYTVSGPLASFVGFISKSFGEAVIYANYLQYKAFKQGRRYVDLKFFLTKCFPDGLPTDEVLKKMWDAQKVEFFEYGNSDNMLDYVDGQESISFKN
jgi:hypothetical protein